MDHVRLHPMRPQPPRQPEAVAAGFEGKRNPRDLFTGSDCLIAPAMQQAKQPFGTRLQFLARLTLNAGKHTANQPTRLAHLDDGNDRAILVQGDEGPAQVVRLGHQGTPSVKYSDDGTISSPPSPYHLPAGGRWIRTCMGLFLSSRCFWFLLRVLCSEREGRSPSRRLRSGSRSARKGSRDRNASAAWRLAALARLVFRRALTPEHAKGGWAGGGRAFF